MNTVYKYEFPVKDNKWHSVKDGYGEFAIEMPIGARILKVDRQGNNDCIWALVDTDKNTEKVEFAIVGTGREINLDDFPYHVATYFRDPFVWHLFSKQKPIKPY